ncbi:hypothetical protein D3C81_2083420 [compost metagenome]
MLPLRIGAERTDHLTFVKKGLVPVLSLRRSIVIAHQADQYDEEMRRRFAGTNDVLIAGVVAQFEHLQQVLPELGFVHAVTAEKGLEQL